MHGGLLFYYYELEISGTMRRIANDTGFDIFDGY